MIGFLAHRFQTLFWTAFYHAMGKVIFVNLGKGAKFQGWIAIPQHKGRISIGRNVHVCRSVEFSVTDGAELIIKDGAFIGPGTIISAHRRVSIGANVLVGEYVSIHDNNHKTLDQNLPIREQGFETEALEIGDDCWIGAKATLVKGGGLGRRCVLGAGAVLTRKLPDHTTAMGVPARSIEKSASFPVISQEKGILRQNEILPGPWLKRNSSNPPSPHSVRNKIGRFLWNITWIILYRPSPKIAHGWRRFLLRLFGAKIGLGAHLHPSAKIWAPWNLEMGDHSCLGENVDCYCVARIRIGARAAVSQYSFLCTATHDIETSDLALRTAPIVIKDKAWVAADVFVGPGVTIGTGAVIGARSSVFRDVPEGMVAFGTPARPVKRRSPPSFAGCGRP